MKILFTFSTSFQYDNIIKRCYTKKITLQDLNNTNSFDAILITKNYLQEASDNQYTQFYLNSSIPIVFVQSDKAISAFIIPNHTYENTFENHAKDYFIGYYIKKDVKNSDKSESTIKLLQNKVTLLFK
ncbi:hypothetical protein ACIQXI_10290 [Lysinibacillus sp. NPDC097195]|uniref:hypothetical protein n=1 Tax=Lysinibacillus sp. NPDC097195 TaxID=3364141 RepID=UPI00380708B1